MGLGLGTVVGLGLGCEVGGIVVGASEVGGGMTIVNWLVAIETGCGVSFEESSAFISSSSGRTSSASSSVGKIVIIPSNIVSLTVRVSLIPEVSFLVATGTLAFPKRWAPTSRKLPIATTTNAQR